MSVNFFLFFLPHLIVEFFSFLGIIHSQYFLLCHPFPPFASLISPSFLSSPLLVSHLFLCPFPPLYLSSPCPLLILSAPKSSPLLSLFSSSSSPFCARLLHMSSSPTSLLPSYPVIFSLFSSHILSSFPCSSLFSSLFSLSIYLYLSLYLSLSLYPSLSLCLSLSLFLTLSLSLCLSLSFCLCLPLLISI